MACDVVRVRLRLRETRVLRVQVDTPSELRVAVESTVRRPRCPACGFRCARVHDTRRRDIRDLGVSGRRTTLVWHRRRFRCGGYEHRRLEDHPEFDGRLRRRLARRLVADAEVMPVAAAARRHKLGWHLVRAWSGLVAEHRRTRRCRVLLVDETSMRKRRRYVTVILNGDTGRALAMVEHRSSAALTAFLMQQPPKRRRGVKVVVTDGSRAYKASVEACLMQLRGRFRAKAWATGIVDVGRGQLLDTVPGRTAQAPTQWLQQRPRSWPAGVRWAVPGLSGPHRAAFDAAVPHARQAADPFCVVGLANDALDEARRRIQQQTLGHRGHKDDPRYRSRKLLTTASERVTGAGRTRLRGLLDAGDPYREVRDARRR